MDIEKLASSFTELEQLPNLPAAELVGPKLSDSLAERLHPYYRSKLFVTSQSINPLIAAASPIFSIVDKLRYAASSQDLFQLQQDLTHEIKAFANRAQSLGYRSQIVYAARYIVCAWVDEVVAANPISHDEWEKFALVKLLQDDANSSTQFFLLLERCSQDPAIYLDLLELIYLCLSLGCEGEYRKQAGGYNELAAIRDNLYALIRQERGDFSKQLEIAAADDHIVTTKQHNHTWSIVGGFLIAIILSLATYITFNQHLNSAVHTIYNSLQHLLQSTSISEKTG